MLSYSESLFLDRRQNKALTREKETRNLSSDLKKRERGSVDTKMSEPTSLKYGLSRVQLTQMMDFGDKRGIKRVTQYGGVEEIAGHLKTNLKDGLPKDEVQLNERRRMYGKNYLEPNPPKSFIALMYDATQDPILIFLICKSLSLYYTSF